MMGYKHDGTANRSDADGLSRIEKKAKMLAITCIVLAIISIVLLCIGMLCRLAMTQ